MDKVLPTIVVVVVLVLALGAMYWGWRRRGRRDASAGGGYPVPAGQAAPLAEAETFYVASTKAGNHLERLALPGLKFRGRARLTISRDGVTIAIHGEEPVFVAGNAISAIGAATTAIDRAVEKDGLLRLSWTTTGGVAADSFLRVVDPADRAPVIGAIESLLPAHSQAGYTTESEV
ncbi:hypothetical protein ACFVWR_05365 [Leifsonia sp. NPDC058292]|uniref:PH-like domain-containing protein n=1 Tax=Leifsonia sp. NPDC058292 TaxID=3346428 RepID=UPI0036DF78A1